MAGRDEEVVVSEAEEVVHLVDTITDPYLVWVAEEPRCIASRYADSLAGAFRVVEDRTPGSERNWKVSRPTETERICSYYSGDRFPMYEFVFKELGLRLPFSDFQVGVMGRLRLAPSQLHPNAFGFIRAFELVCQYLEIGATTSLFLRCFKIQIQTVEGKHGWVSLKNNGKRLFKMFVDSVRNFKDKYFLVTSVSESAFSSALELTTEVDDEGNVLYDEDGNVKTELVSLFPFHWTEAHFDEEPKDYLVKHEELSEDDQDSYIKLCHYVDSFFPAQWVTRDNREIVDENDEPIFEARVIDTRALLGCKTLGEAMELLGFACIFSLLMLGSCFYCRCRINHTCLFCR